MSTPEEKREKKALYNKNHREKLKQKKLLENLEIKEEKKEEIQEIQEIQENIPEEKKDETIPETIDENNELESNDIVVLSRDEYEFLIEQIARKKVRSEPEPEPEKINATPKEDTFFFRLQNSIKNQMISSMASMGSVLALSLAIRGTQSLMNSMNKSSIKSLTSTTSNATESNVEETLCPRVVNFA